MSNPRLTIVGATGAVGAVALQVLAERSFPMSRLRLTASPRSVGRKIDFAGKAIRVEETTPDVFDASDIAFISATDEISRDMAEEARNRGCVTIDDSGVWRMHPEVPVVVPEVNSDDVDDHKGILSIPNCSTTPLVMALDALRAEARIERVIATTYQSVTGAGSAALVELEEQTRSVLGDGDVRAEQHPHQIAFNVLPHIGSLRENGYYSEEAKMIDETRKILHEPNLAISTTCVRVPVRVSHSVAAHIELNRAIGATRARELLGAYPGIVVMDDPANGVYPMPINGAGSDDVFAGRIREDLALHNGLALWLVCDNLRKGAATNAVQIAEEIVERDAWLR